MRKIFISGGISNVKDYKKNFKNAKRFLAQFKDYEVISPTDLKPFNNKCTWSAWMRSCLKELSECYEIYMLKGWWKSKGSRTEWFIAKILNIKIRYQTTQEVEIFEK